VVLSETEKATRRCRDRDVVHREQHGVFVDIGEEFLSFIDPACMPLPYNSSINDYPNVGTEVRARIIHFADSNRQMRMRMEP